MRGPLPRVPKTSCEVRSRHVSKPHCSKLLLRSNYLSSGCIFCRRQRTALVDTNVLQTRIPQVELPGELPVCWGDSSPWEQDQDFVRPINRHGLGWQYLSNATCLMRPQFALCVFRRVKDHHNLLHYSPPLKKTCVRQAVLDKRFPLHAPSGVCEKNTPPEKNTCGKISFQSTKSGAGEQFLLQDCRARACAKGTLFSQTPVARKHGRSACLLRAMVPGAALSDSGGVRGRRGLRSRRRRRSASVRAGGLSNAHARVALSFRQPMFQQFTKTQ